MDDINFLILLLPVCLYGRNLIGAGKEIDNTVKQGLDSDVLQGGSHEDRQQGALEGALAQCGHYEVGWDFLSLEVELRDLIGVGRTGVNELFPVLLGLLKVIGRNVLFGNRDTPVLGREV